MASKAYYIVGLGATGLALARYITRAAITFYVWDDNPDNRQHAIDLGYNVLDPSSWQDAHNISRFFLSPGIAHLGDKAHISAQKAYKYGLAIETDINLFVEQLSGNQRLIVVTGTNGKSTTVSLLYDVMKAANLRVSLGGNIGRAVFDLPPDSSYYILELSSYQIERLDHATIYGSIILNISPDHLDRHGTLTHYSAIKYSIIDMVSPEGIAIIGIDDSIGRAYYAEHPSIQAISGYDHDDDAIIQASDAHSILKGAHYKQNMAAVKAMAQFLAIDDVLINDICRHFKPLRHRQEIIYRDDALIIIDDSKATNCDSAALSIASFSNIIWFGGGIVKPHDSMSSIAKHAQHINHAFFFGQDAQLLYEYYRDYMACTVTDNLEQACTQAYDYYNTDYTHYRPHDNTPLCLLLAPAAASFDQFKNFEERGNIFASYITKLFCS